MPTRSYVLEKAKDGWLLRRYGTWEVLDMGPDYDPVQRRALVRLRPFAPCVLRLYESEVAWRLGSADAEWDLVAPPPPPAT